MLKAGYFSVFIRHGSKWGQMRNIPGGTILPPAWRVGIVEPARVAPIAFARLKDAEAAKAALEAKGLDTLEKWIETGADELERIMFEALQW